MISRRALLTVVLSLGFSGALSRSARAQTYSDHEMRAFAGATLDLQKLGSRDPAAMTHVIKAAGLSVEQYNRMGDTMRADPRMAARLTPYLDQARQVRNGRAKATTTYDPNRPYDPGTGRKGTTRRKTTRRPRTTKKKKK